MGMYLYPSISVCLSVYLERFSLVLSSSSKDDQEHTYRRKEEIKKLGSFCFATARESSQREHVEHLRERGG